MRDALRIEVIKAVAGLEGYENPNTTPGHYWDKRCIPVMAVFDAYAALAARSEPDGVVWSDDDISGLYQRAFDKGMEAARSEPGTEDARLIGDHEGFDRGYRAGVLAARSEPEPALGEMLVAYRITTTPGESVPAGWTRIGVWEQSAARSEPGAEGLNVERLTAAINAVLPNGIYRGQVERIAREYAARSEPGDVEAMVDDIVERYGGALDALARSEPGAAGLDVERLARAITAQWTLVRRKAYTDGGTPLNIARALAREYAALAETEPKP